MGYQNAAEVLPTSVLEAVQQYVDGQYVYIPRREDRRRAWGDDTPTRDEIRVRNRDIRKRHRQGAAVRELADFFCLSPKTIYRILKA